MLRARTKLAPRPRFTPLPLATTARDRPGDDGRADDGIEGSREAAACCCRVIFLTCVKKLLGLPALGASDRMRPGFGRKRFSSSALKGATPAKTAGNRPIWACSAARNPEKPRLCAKSRHAAPQSH